MASRRHTPVGAGQHERRLAAGCPLIDDRMEELLGSVQAANGGLRLLGVQQGPAMRLERLYDGCDDLHVAPCRRPVEDAVAIAEPGVICQLRPSL